MYILWILSGFWRLGWLARLMLVAWLCAGTVGTANASWLEAITGPARSVVKGDELATGQKLIAKLDVKPPGLVLAASVTAEGHWTFVTQAGQRYTAASEQEMSRVYKTLVPDFTNRPAPVVLYLTEASVFTHGEHLKELPVDARLRVIAGKGSYPLRGFGRGAKRTWFAEVRPNVFVRAWERERFVETVWQLARPLKSRAMRVLALEPGARDTFRPSAVTRVDGVTKQTIDTINPGKLISALSTLRRQTAVLTGRVKAGDALVYRTSSGAERTLALAPLKAAAAADDVNLVFLNAAAPRQPGVRNWLWLKAEVDGLVEALQRDTLGGFLNVLTGNTGRLFVETRAQSPDRVSLSVIPMRAGVLEKEPGTLSGLLAELVSEVAGSVLPHAIDADLVSMRRQQELDRRLLPGIASWLQLMFGAALLIGLIGLPVALRWWRQIWMPEDRGEYANRAGFEFARGVKWVVFLVLFLPIAGVPAVIWGLVRGIGWVLRGGRRRERADAGAATG